MNCQNCGSKIPKGAKFCPNCATAVSASATKSRAAASVASAPAVPNETIKYRTSLFSKGEINIEENFVAFKEPNMVLGIIPLGAQENRIPVTNINSTATNFKPALLPLLLGVIITMLGWSMMSNSDSSTLGLIVLVVGISELLDAFEVNLVVTDLAGQQKLIDFFIFEKRKADYISQQINAAISGRLYDTNIRHQMDAFYRR